MNNTYKRLLGNKWVLRAADTQEQVVSAPTVKMTAMITTSSAQPIATPVKSIQSQQDYKLIILGHNMSPGMLLQDDNTQTTIMLKKMLQAMKLDLEAEVYLHSLPSSDDTAEIPCSFQFIEELNLQASAICLFGTQAIKSDFIPNMAINKIRGQDLSYKNIPIIVTFSLPYILRNPDVKPLVWSDLQKIMAIINN